MNKKNSFKQFQSYEGCELYGPEAQFLKTVEFLLGLKIPELDLETFKEKGFGFVAKNKHIIHFVLCNKNLFLIPNSITNLQELETLDLRGNNIKDLPDTINNLQNLKEIRLNEEKDQQINNKPKSLSPDTFNTHLDVRETNSVKFNQQKFSNQSKLLKVKILFDSKVSNINEILGDFKKNTENRNINNQNYDYKNKPNLKDKFKDTVDRAREEQESQLICNKSKIKIFFNSKISRIYDILGELEKNNENRKKANQNYEKRKAQRSKLICKKFNIVKCKIQKIDLEIVRRSPRKLVFVIKSVIIECLNCNETKKINNPSQFILDFLSKLNNILTNEIISHLKQNLYCKNCNKFYGNIDKCPIHINSLDYPRLVFIRGINKQFISNLLLRQMKIKV